MASITRHIVRARLDSLPMPAARTHSVRHRENSSEPLHHSRLAADHGPPLRRMIADLEEATIDRDVVPVDVEDDDVARGNPNHRIPRAAAQRVRPGGTDARPAFDLQPRGRDSIETFHVL